MFEIYTCGHVAEHDDEGCYTNGSFAVWEEYTRDWQIAQAYGVLCNDCVSVYGAKKCKMGGVEIIED